MIGVFYRRPSPGAEMFVNMCTPEDAAWAASRLGRQAWLPSTEPCPLTALPDCPSAYIACAHDRVIDPAWQRRAAREQVGVEPVELEADHSPFLSRPALLADALASIARA